MDRNAEQKIWSDHPNPIAADAERRLYLMGAWKLEDIRRAVFKQLDLPEPKKGKE